MKKNVILKVSRSVPVYGGTIWLVVAHDAPQAYADLVVPLGLDNKPPREKPTFKARSAYEYEWGVFGLFFDCRPSHADVAHECFHQTHHILNRVNYKFDPENQEAAAYLNDTLTDWVYRQLKKAGIRVSI